MNTWDYGFWEIIVQAGILMSAILLANILRRKVPFVRKSLLPSAVIGGLLIFVLKFFDGFSDIINNTFMEAAAYHCLALGFISLALKKSEHKVEKDQKGIIVKTGAVVVSTYLIQGVFGLTLTILLSFVMTDLLPASGLLLALGYGQGPGQALNFGSVYETGYGFFGGASFGLTIATVGFLVSCIGGVIFLNILKRQNKIKVNSQSESTYQTLQNVSNPNDIPLSESIDKFTVQTALVAAVYLVTFLFMFGISYFIDNGFLGNFGTKTLKPLIWGFNFLFGTMFALLAKLLIQKLRKTNVMTREYPNNFLLNRISGLAFDFMILAGISAIKIQTIAELLLPLLLLCVIGGVVTFVYLNIVCKKLYPSYRYEAMVSLFGMLTGTASTGMILLREIDPSFETPAANTLVLQTVPAMIFGFPLLLLVGYAPNGLSACFITMAICILMFLFFNFMIFYKRKKIKQTV